MIIPNWQYKKYYISEQYLKYGDYDIMEFISDMQTSNPNFFSWLFDDSSLMGYSAFQLDEEHYRAWSQFVRSFDPYDD